MAWEKLGVIFNTSGSPEWMSSHPYLPTTIEMAGERIRIFLAFRDASNVGRIGFVDVAASNPLRVLRVSDVPSLDVGRPGCFDDSGVSPLSVVRDGKRLRLYYAGWQLTPRARYLLFTGLAFSDDDGLSFARYRETPILERSPSELIVRSGSAVIKDGPVWKVWYAAGSDVVESGSKLVPTYHLAYAESEDGLRWPEKGIVAIEPRAPDEFGFGRPHVEKVGDEFRIWYSVRSHSRTYRIGYATSRDGIEWNRRDDDVGIDVSPEGWDSKMIGFASIIDNAHGRFMFYNGNDYGKTGVGLARWAA